MNNDADRIIWRLQRIEQQLDRLLRLAEKVVKSREENPTNLSAEEWAEKIAGDTAQAND